MVEITIEFLIMVASALAFYFIGNTIGFKKGYDKAKLESASEYFDGYNSGKDAGYKKGYEKGNADGLSKGFDDGKRYAMTIEHNRQVLVAEGILKDGTESKEGSPKRKWNKRTKA